MVLAAPEDEHTRLLFQEETKLCTEGDSLSYYHYYCSFGGESCSVRVSPCGEETMKVHYTEQVLFHGHCHLLMQTSFIRLKTDFWLMKTNLFWRPGGQEREPGISFTFNTSLFKTFSININYSLPYMQ